MTRTKIKWRTGFTLIELLAVVGITLLLLGILIPGLRAAREKGGRTTCISNLRQLMSASILYGGDNNSHLPFANEDSLEVSWWKGPGWLYKTPIPAVPTAANLQESALWPYLRSEKVYRCPMHEGPYTKVENITSYIMNYAVVGNNSVAPKCEKPSYLLSNFRGTDVCFWETEDTGYGANTWSDGDNQPDGGITKRHNDGAPVACFGGAVEWISYSNYYAMANDKVNRNRLWCSPESANGH